MDTICCAMIHSIFKQDPTDLFVDSKLLKACKTSRKALLNSQ